jgi:hypothetical protein
MNPDPDAERRRERYRRHEQAAGIDADRLASMRLVVVGAGAVGNEVVKNAALLGVGRIEVHDFDSIEIHNLTRSVFFRESDLGRPKATTLAARAAEVDPNVRVHAVEGDAWRTLTLDSLRGATALVACVDQFEARMRLSQLAWLAGVHFVNLGIDSRHASVESHPFDRAAASGTACACFECHLPASAYRQVAQRYSCGWLRRALWVDRTVPTTAITASVAGALGVQAALRLGADADADADADAAPPTAWRLLIDTRSGQTSRSTLARQPDCLACGRWPRRPARVAAGRRWREAVATGAEPDDAVLLSDALVFGAACVRCGPAPATRALHGRRAADLDDRVMRCGACGEWSVRLDLRTETTAGDLLEAFGADPPPIKYLLVARDDRPLCLDLQADPAAAPSGPDDPVNPME